MLLSYYLLVVGHLSILLLCPLDCEFSEARDTVKCCTNSNKNTVVLNLFRFDDTPIVVLNQQQLLLLLPGKVLRIPGVQPGLEGLQHMCMLLSPTEFSDKPRAGRSTCSCHSLCRAGLGKSPRIRYMGQVQVSFIASVSRSSMVGAD